MVGEEEAIRWRSTGTIPQVSLEYSLDGFQEDVRVIQKAVRTMGKAVESYIWKIPDEISDRVWIRVTDVRDASVQAVTERPFKIKGRFDVAFPVPPVAAHTLPRRWAYPRSVQPTNSPLFH